MKRILIIDNYDSFTFNLVHAVYDILGQEVDVKRNDEIDLTYIDQYEYVILSPGPGIPDEAGILKEAISQFYKTKKMLGVCLGHQAIFEVLGGKLENLKHVYHGIQSDMYISSEPNTLFKGIKSSFKAGRYHSWIGDLDTIPKELIVTSRDDQDQIMSFRHQSLPVFGVQFHPESILTPQGNHILNNFLSL